MTDEELSAQVSFPKSIVDGAQAQRARDEIARRKASERAKVDAARREAEMAAAIQRERDAGIERELAKPMVDCPTDPHTDDHWERAFCTDPELEDERAALLGAYRRAVPAAVGDWGVASQTFTGRRHVWSIYGGEACERREGVDRVCLRREIQWRIDELNGGTPVFRSRENYQEQQAKVQARADARRTADIKRALASHPDTLARRFGQCEKLTAWGEEIYCNGNAIGTIRQVREFVMANARDDSGAPLNDVDRRAIRTYLDATLSAHAAATTIAPDAFLHRQYGEVLFDMMSLGVRVDR